MVFTLLLLTNDGRFFRIKIKTVIGGIRMAREDYHSARVQGRRAYRADVQAGRYPYLPALDDMISFSETQGEYPLGRVDIPLNLIVGTKTAAARKPLPAISCPFWVKLPSLA